MLYGDIDFNRIPERLALGPDDETDLPPYVKITHEELFADADLIDLMATATMLGDVPCDAYACLLPELGMQRLIELVRTACHEGLDAVAGTATGARRLHRVHGGGARLDRARSGRTGCPHRTGPARP